jgi:hypothetical protein
MSTQPTVAEAAELYAQAGWSVLPLHDVTRGYCSCVDGPECRVAGKHPRIRGAHHAATADLQQVREWWADWPHANVAVATGRPLGLVAVDIDGRAGRESWERLVTEHGAVPDTAHARTPHGQHLWYRLPAGVTVPRRIGSIAAHVDVLGAKGFAVLPPSFIGTEHPARHEGRCTGTYQWSEPRRAILPLPEWVATLANQRERAEGAERETPAHAARAMGGRTYGMSALRGEVARVTHAQPGSRNETLNRSAFRLGQLIGGGELDREIAEEALVQAAEDCGLVKDDGLVQAARTILSGLDAGQRCPKSREAKSHGRSRRAL